MQNELATAYVESVHGAVGPSCAKDVARSEAQRKPIGAPIEC